MTTEPSNPIDTIIADLEGTAVSVAVSEILSWAAANIWVGFASVFVSPILGWFVGLVISILMQKLDWISYMLIEDWETTKQGEDYATAAKNLQALPPQATPAELEAARQAKIAAFKRLISYGSAASSP